MLVKSALLKLFKRLNPYIIYEGYAPIANTMPDFSEFHFIPLRFYKKNLHQFLFSLTKRNLKRIFTFMKKRQKYLAFVL